MLASFLHFSHLTIFALPQLGQSNFTQFFWFSILTPQLVHFMLIPVPGPGRLVLPSGQLQ
jgi:hypothetical protein